MFDKFFKSNNRTNYIIDPCGQFTESQDSFTANNLLIKFRLRNIYIQACDFIREKLVKLIKGHQFDRRKRV